LTTFSATFKAPAVAMEAPRCDCAEFTIDLPKGETITPAQKLKVKGTLTWPSELDARPGQRLTTVEVMQPNGTVLGTLTWPKEGKSGKDGVVEVSGEIDIANLFRAGTTEPLTYQVTLRATFFDGTQLRSGVARFSLLAVQPTAVRPTPGAGGAAGYWKYRETRFLPGGCSSAYQCQGTGSNGNLSGTVVYGTTSGTASYSWTWNAGAGKTMDRLDVGQTVTVTARGTGSGSLNLLDGLVIRLEKDDMARGTTWTTAVDIVNLNRPGAQAVTGSGSIKLPAGPYFLGRNSIALRAESNSFGAVDLIYDWVPN
jgi:hypothetical protein